MELLPLSKLGNWAFRREKSPESTYGFNVAPLMRRTRPFTKGLRQGPTRIKGAHPALRSFASHGRNRQRHFCAALRSPRTRRTTPSTVRPAADEVHLRRAPATLIALAEHGAFVLTVMLAINVSAAARQGLSGVGHACRPSFAANAAKGMLCPPAGSQITSVSRARVIMTYPNLITASRSFRLPSHCLIPEAERSGNT